MFMILFQNPPPKKTVSPIYLRNRTPKNEKRALETSGLFSLLIISALWTWLFGISALPRFRLLICESLTEDGTYGSWLLICESLMEDSTHGPRLLICESLTEDSTYRRHTRVSALDLQIFNGRRHIRIQALNLQIFNRRRHTRVPALDL
ncbi:unnamed protein product [Rhizophagus irregularis]|nr:unnamed protein product [Rhizophagus irregularis]